MQVKIDFCEEVEPGPEDKDSLSSLITETLNCEGINNEYEVSVHFVDNETIQELNHQYLNNDAVTDVLSFPLLSQAEIKHEYDYPVMLGDIFICIPQAIEQAAKLGHRLEREMGFLCVHGLLHLLGYDHADVDDAEAMFAKQEALLAKNGLKREINA